MCIIAYGKIEKLRPNIAKMMETNGDGAGFAFTPDNKVIHFEKGISRTATMEEKLADIRDGADVLFHARIATHGGRSLLLTHPFPIGQSTDLCFEGDATSVLAHNGIWSGYHPFEKAIPEKTGPWSDTRVMAYLLEEGIVSPKFLDYAGGSWIILYPDKSPYFAGRWETEDGVNYSNLLWKFSKTSYLYGDGILDDVWEKVPLSEAYTADEQRTFPYNYEPDYRQHWERVNDTPESKAETDYYKFYAEKRRRFNAELRMVP